MVVYVRSMNNIQWGVTVFASTVLIGELTCIIRPRVVRPKSHIPEVTSFSFNYKNISLKYTNCNRITFTVFDKRAREQYSVFLKKIQIEN